MIIYALHVNRGGSCRYFTNKQTAIRCFNEIKAESDNSDKILIDTETEYEIERPYDYGWCYKGAAFIKWSLKEIEVEEE